MKPFVIILLSSLFILASCQKCDRNKTCQNGGRLDVDCNCICPSGYTGSNCQIAPPPPPPPQSANCSVTDLSQAWTSPGGQQYVNQAERVLPAHMFMTGVGLSISNNSVVTLMVKGRELRSDCTWGVQSEYRSGSNQNGSLQRQFTVPTGSAITGIQWGIQNGAVSRLVVKYRPLQSTADGRIRLGDESTYDSGGGSNEFSGLLITNFNYNPERTVFAGFGARRISPNGQQTWGHFRRINP